MKPFGCSAFLYHEEKVLLVKGKPSEISWSLPGGEIAQNKTAEQYIIAKVKQDVGLEIVPVSLVGLYGHPKRGRDVVSALYSCRIIGGQLCPGNDIFNLGWFHPHSLPPLNDAKAGMIQDALTMLALQSEGRKPQFNMQKNTI